MGAKKNRARGLVMDTEGAGAPAVPIPKTYSRNGRWTVYSSSGRNPPKKRDPNRVLSREAQARREKEYELGTKVWAGRHAYRVNRYSYVLRSMFITRFPCGRWG